MTSGRFFYDNPLTKMKNISKNPNSTQILGLEEYSRLPGIYWGFDLLLQADSRTTGGML